MDMIPKDVVICDWHYERPDRTAVYFAKKDLRVVTCPWAHARGCRGPGGGYGEVPAIRYQGYERPLKAKEKELKPISS
jgi:hypothetical protein